MEITESLRKDLVILAACLAVGGFAVAAQNVAAPTEGVEVGPTEVYTECVGIEAGICLGFQKETHETHNYDNYQTPEEGSEDYYRKIESELMVRAYNTCDQDMSGYEWTSEVEYEGQTAEEWRSNENIDLLPCEKTLYRDLEDSS